MDSEGEKMPYQVPLSIAQSLTILDIHKEGVGHMMTTGRQLAESSSSVLVPIEVRSLVPQVS